MAGGLLAVRDLTLVNRWKRRRLTTRMIITPPASSCWVWLAKQDQR